MDFSATSMGCSLSPDQKKTDAESLCWTPGTESSMPWQRLAYMRVENNQDLPVRENCAKNF